MQQQSILLTTLNAKYIHMNLAIRLLYELNKTDERLSWKEFAIKEDKLIIPHCHGKQLLVPAMVRGVLNAPARGQLPAGQTVVLHVVGCL